MQPVGSYGITNSATLMLLCWERIKALLCGPASALPWACSNFHYNLKLSMENAVFTEAHGPEKPPQHECSSEPESLLEKLEGREDPINWSHFSKCM